MNKIIEVLKANKKSILKGVLIVGGAAAGLAVIGKAISAGQNDEDDFDCVDESDEIEE